MPAENRRQEPAGRAKRLGGASYDAEMLYTRSSDLKQRQDSIEKYTKAQRPDLAEKEAAEWDILKEYLPQPLSEDELHALVDATIAKVGAASPRDMGRVMTAIMAEYAGRVDGKILSAAVKARLQG